jgi:hypothetical protein
LNCVCGPPGASFISVKLMTMIPSRSGISPRLRRMMYLLIDPYA